MNLKRKIYQNLLKWKLSSSGESALLIEGPRRVGKSYIVEQFAREEYKSYILIDFSNIQEEVLSIIDDLKTNLDKLFNYLSLYYNVKLYERESIIIFDEIQFYPKIRGLIKHLVHHGKYDYIETGSLISLKQNVQDILIPSEEESLTMYPLDFEEYLWAYNDETSIPFIKERFSKRMPIGEAIHKKIMRSYKEYLLVGGMPQAVIKYLETNDFYEADKVKRRILDLYRKDVSKFAKGYEYKVLAIFDEIPS